MVGDHERNAAEAMDFPAQVAEALLDAEERLGRRAAERHYHLRLDEGDLTIQVRNARRDLVGQRLPVLRRPALYDVGDVYIFAPESDSLEDAVEQVARLAHEWPPGLILRGARCLAHQ